jgi:murein DD-endopeptidase MepM/ murein hydrolase activator NlpD
MRYPLKNWFKIKRGYKFGEKTFYSERHLGMDYVVPVGTPVYAPCACEIVKSGNFPEGGSTLHASFRKRGWGKLVMRCMHLSKMSPLGKYKAGDILGYSGNTGALTKGPHLHIDLSRKKVEVSNFQNFIDPEEFFAGKAGKKGNCPKHQKVL